MLLAGDWMPTRLAWLWLCLCAVYSMGSSTSVPTEKVSLLIKWRLSFFLLLAAAGLVVWDSASSSYKPELSLINILLFGVGTPSSAKYMYESCAFSRLNLFFSSTDLFITWRTILFFLSASWLIML